MPQLLKCVNGHEWEASIASGMDASLASLTCPRCGSPAQGEKPTIGDSPERATVISDALPPAPRAGPAASPRPRIPGYEILRELGRGGMGVVYLAEQVSLKRMVALKMLLTGAFAADEGRTRFRFEAETLAHLNHPNIVHIYDIGLHDGFAFFTMEYVEGDSLAQRLRGQRIPTREAAELVRVLAAAMAFAHSRDMIHRDLKPGNILLQNENTVGSASPTAAASPLSGIPKIADFGLAKRPDGIDLTRSGVAMGTPEYMAPEQAHGKSGAIGPPTDVYSLGAILYELLVGRPPFTGTSTLEILRQVTEVQPVPPSQHAPVPRALETICLRCLEKSPERRYASGQELADDLDRYLKGDALPARSPRRRMAALLLFPLACCLLAILVGHFMSRDASGPDKRPLEPSGAAPEPHPESTPADGNVNDAGTKQKVAPAEVPPGTPIPVKTNDPDLKTELLPGPGGKR